MGTSFQAAPSGKPAQMSPPRAADPATDRPTTDGPTTDGSILRPARRDGDRGPYADRVLHDDATSIPTGSPAVRLLGWPTCGFLLAPDTGTGGALGSLDAVDEADLTAADIAWDLDPLLAGATVDELFDEADALATQIEGARGALATLA